MTRRPLGTWRGRTDLNERGDFWTGSEKQDLYDISISGPIGPFILNLHCYDSSNVK